MNATKDTATVAELPLVRSAQLLEQWLEERGLDKEDGYFELLPPELLPQDSSFLGGSGRTSPCFRIVTHDPAGTPRPELSRVRYGTAHKDARYRNPPRVGVVIYAPHPESFANFAAATHVAIGEGEGKTMALVRAGAPALGIGGCWNWRGRDGRLHPDLRSALQPGKVVELYIDGDWHTNPDVHRAAYMLMYALRGAGAKPRLVDLPAVPGMGKLGIDDQIKLWRDAGTDVTRALASLTRLESIPSPFVVDLKNPFETAKHFLEALYSSADGPTLLHWQGDFFEWTGPHWVTKAEELIREQLYAFVAEHGSTPKRNNVTELLDALRAAAQAQVSEAPAWLDPGIMSAEVLALANGLLDVATGQLHAPTPRYFNLSSSDASFDASATCPRWDRFLTDVYPDDATARACLQEFVGYCLTDDTSQQKAIALIGAKRSGKGTIARVVQAVVGHSSCCAPTMQSLGERFGMQTWIGKRVALVQDARTSARNDGQAMVERVLGVTGEDTQYIDRKNKEPWEGRLRVRVWLMSNMLPTTQDKGGALASRFLILPHKVTFYGREDSGLESALRGELSGILNWALAGLRRLRQRGHFVQPTSGADRVRDWERLNSPMLAFIEERCRLGPAEWVEKARLREAYGVWCAANNLPMCRSDAAFTEELLAATEQQVQTAQRREGKRLRVFTGVGLPEGRV